MGLFGTLDRGVNALGGLAAAVTPTLIKEYEKNRQEQFMLDLAAASPTVADAYAKQQAVSNAADAESSGQNLPAPVRTYQFYENLTPEQRQRFLESQGQGYAVDDLGGYLRVRNKFTNEVVDVQPKSPPPQDLPEFRGEQAAQVELGKFGAEGFKSAAVAFETLPGALKNIDDMLGIVGENDDGSLIYDMDRFQGFAKNFGTAAKIPNVPGSAAANASVLIKQFRGKQFLGEIDAMKGYGSLSDTEGKAVRAAAENLDQEQDPKEAARKILFIREKTKLGLYRAEEIRAGRMEPHTFRVINPQQAAPASPAPSQSNIAQPMGGVKTFNPATGKIE